MDGELLGLGVDVDLAEELVSVRWGGVRRRGVWVKTALRAERGVQRVGSERAGVEGSGDELPEGVKSR